MKQAYIIGRAKNKVILDQTGSVVAEFVGENAEQLAAEYSEFKNGKAYNSLELLGDDDESCKKLFEFVYSNVRYGYKIINKEFLFIELIGDETTELKHSLVIGLEGYFGMIRPDPEEPIPNQFAVLDFVRSLGYQSDQ